MKKFSRDIKEQISQRFQDYTAQGGEVIDLDQLIEQMRDCKSVNRQLHVNGWPGLGAKFGGFRTGELTMLTGDTGHGKSTFGFNVLYQLLEAGRVGAVFSLEMGPNAFGRKLYQMQGGEEFEPGMSMGGFEAWALGKDLWLYNSSGRVKYWDQMRLMIAYLALDCAVQFVLIDHLHLLIHPTWDAAHIEAVAADLRYLAESLNISICCIVHPSKIQGDRKERVIQMDDLKGSSGLKQYADNVLSIFFDKKNKVTKLILHKIRHDRYGANMGDTLLYRLNRDNLLFEEAVE